MDGEDLERLRRDYDVVAPLGQRLVGCITEQLKELFGANEISLGVPLESRVKTLASLEEKTNRKGLRLERIDHLDDFVGIRIILLFRKDLIRAGEVIKNHFEVLSFEDTSTRLDATQFGYQSDHYIVRIREEWEGVPTYRGLRELKAELQVRTLSQHIWAAASHKLQYKQEANVPKPLLRTIHRVSALLETVDLELDRVESERSDYLESVSPKLDGATGLNVEIVAKVLADSWPSKNLSPGEEDYDRLVTELRYFGITTAGQLSAFISSYRKEVLEHERNTIEGMLKRTNIPAYYLDRAKSGFYFTQVALTRIAMRRKFGEEKVSQIVECEGDAGTSSNRAKPKALAKPRRPAKSKKA